LELKLSELEKKQLLIWASNTIEGGHFGDSNVVFPEEGITLNKLETTKNGKLNVNEQDVKIMIIWCENAIGQSLKGMTSEEISLIDKLKNAESELTK